MENKFKTPSVENICKRTNKSEHEVCSFIDLIKRSMAPLAKRISVKENQKVRSYEVERRGIGMLNTKYGKFWQYNFAITDYWEKYSVIVKAEIDTVKIIPIFKNRQKLVVRIDSGCETGQIFGDLTCECRGQLHIILKMLSEIDEGIIINIPRQDGRGMGLTFKLATLWLQDELELNTVEAASLLASDGVIDIRTYSGAIGILKFFEIADTCVINLATNNPKKAEIFAENGYVVSDYVPVLVAPSDFTKAHLQAKQKHLGHKNLIQPERIDIK